MARKRAGWTAKKLLQWALNFAQEDFAGLHPGDILSRQLELTAFATPDWYWQFHTDDTASMEIATSAHLFQAYLMFRDAITVGFRLPPPARNPVRFEIILDKEKRPEFRITAADDRFLAFLRFGDLINEFRDQLRRCKDAQCQHWFIGPKGKEFCSVQCVNRVAKDRKRHPERYKS